MGKCLKIIKLEVERIMPRYSTWQCAVCVNAKNRSVAYYLGKSIEVCEDCLTKLLSGTAERSSYKYDKGYGND